jgi:hypothetical protein
MKRWFEAVRYRTYESRNTLRFPAFTFVVGVAALAFSGLASADPPSRVARLGYTTGAVSLSPAGLGDRPPARVFERPVVARTAPPPAHVSFTAQQPQLTAKPGKPLDDAARKELKPAAAPVPLVKVLTAAQVAPSTSPPAARPGEARGKPDGSKFPVAPRVPVASPLSPPSAQVAAPPKMMVAPAPKAEPYAQGPRPAASKPTELKNDDEERRREEEAHKQKR